MEYPIFLFTTHSSSNGGWYHLACAVNFHRQRRPTRWKWLSLRRTNEIDCLTKASSKTSRTEDCCGKMCALHQKPTVCHPSDRTLLSWKAWLTWIWRAWRHDWWWHIGGQFGFGTLRSHIESGSRRKGVDTPKRWKKSLSLSSALRHISPINTKMPLRYCTCRCSARLRSERIALGRGIDRANCSTLQTL